MSLQNRIRRMIEALDSEYLQGAEPAHDDTGRSYGGLIFTANNDDKSDIPQYRKGEYFTFLQIVDNPDGKKSVRMSRNSDGAVLTLPASSPFTLVGDDLKKSKTKDKEKQKSKDRDREKDAIIDMLRQAMDS